MPICASNVKQSRLAGCCSWFLTIVVFTAIASCPATSQTLDEPDVFLWAAETLAEYDGGNADYIRRLYQPVVEDYPDLTSCISNEAIPANDVQLTISDIRHLPSVEAKDVCIFYALSRLENVEEMIIEIKALGFGTVQHTRLSEDHDLRADWKSTNGSILGDGVLSWFYERFASAWGIRVSVSADGRVETVQIRGRSFIRL